MFSLNVEASIVWVHVSNVYFHLLSHCWTSAYALSWLCFSGSPEPHKWQRLRKARESMSKLKCPEASSYAMGVDESTSRLVGM